MFFQVKPGVFLNMDHIHQIKKETHEKDGDVVVIQMGSAFVRIPKSSKWRTEIKSETVKSIVEQLFKERKRRA
jgi:hypothetical protein